MRAMNLGEISQKIVAVRITLTLNQLVLLAMQANASHRAEEAVRLPRLHGLDPHVQVLYCVCAFCTLVCICVLARVQAQAAVAENPNNRNSVTSFPRNICALQNPADHLARPIRWSFATHLGLAARRRLAQEAVAREELSPATETQQAQYSATTPPTTTPCGVAKLPRAPPCGKGQFLWRIGLAFAPP